MPMHGHQFKLLTGSGTGEPAEISLPTPYLSFDTSNLQDRQRCSRLQFHLETALGSRSSLEHPQASRRLPIARCLVVGGGRDGQHGGDVAAPEEPFQWRCRPVR